MKVYIAGLITSKNVTIMDYDSEVESNQRKCSINV